MNYTVIVNDEWIKLVNKSVKKYLESWPGGEPEEQVALHALSQQLDRLALEVMFDS